MTNPEVKSIIKNRLNALEGICQMFLDGVINSMNNLPYGIRWICKQIKNLSVVRSSFCPVSRMSAEPTHLRNALVKLWTMTKY